MRHKFNIGNTALSLLSYKGLFYPGIFANIPAPVDGGERYVVDGAVREPQFSTKTGSPLRKEDLRMGVTYFMPVMLGRLEIPNAAISITGKKTIVETPLVGVSGSIKELISIDDYEITISGTLRGDDGQYPEDLISEVRDLWLKNEAVQLISAITDFLLQHEDKVVIKTIDFLQVGAHEDAQQVKITAVSDKPYELEIE